MGSTLFFDQKHFECQKGETVLETLERYGRKIPCACRNGICHSCLMLCEKGDPGAQATTALSMDLRQKGYFLPCQCIPNESLHIRLADPDDLTRQATLIKKQWLNPTTAQLLLQPESPILYKGGQYLKIRHHDLSRSYSIASNLIEDAYIELHIKKMPAGNISHWLCDGIEEQSTLNFIGPLGDCVYKSEHKDKNLLLIATGTGLAPLQGIVKEALSEGHKGRIYLYHGSTYLENLYNLDYLHQLQKHSNFQYNPCTSREQSRQENGLDVLSGRADENAFARHTQLQDYCVYICGRGELIENARQQAKKLGAQHIYYEDFDS